MEESKVIVHGFWASAYVYRVIWALKLKGVKYDYIEEDFSNKSQSLLEYNPVHKKVPVLVHGGRPVVESLVILEYIEETWSDDPLTSLLPSDAYERSVARFWIDFGQHVSLTLFAFFLSSDENKETTSKKARETLEIIQDQALGGKKFFGGNRLGLVDLSYGWLAHWLEPIQELVGVKVLEPNTLPRLYQWTIDFKHEPVIKDNLPDSKALLEHTTRQRKKFTSPENN
ncbi:hypothetical protein ABFX02_08G034600 [Erythranthe guttata]